MLNIDGGFVNGYTPGSILGMCSRDFSEVDACADYLLSVPITMVFVWF